MFEEEDVREDLNDGCPSLGNAVRTTYNNVEKLRPLSCNNSVELWQLLKIAWKGEGHNISYMVNW